MINVNDTGMDLVFDVSQWKKKNSNTGAGVNANTKADIMNFAGSGTLAELVWSPQTGLNIKFAQNKPRFMWEEAPSEKRHLDTKNEQHISSVVPSHHVSGEVVKSSSCTGSQNQRAADTLCKQLFENGITSNVNDSCPESISPLKVEPMMQSGPHEQVAVFEKESDWKHEAKSHGSMTSCRSANLSSKRKRLCSFEQQLILGCKRIKKQLLMKQARLYEGVSKEAPNGMFETIRRLRLSRTDIHKWMNTKLSVADLDGFFLRLRVAELGEGAEGPRYYVACITGLQWDTPRKDFKQPIRVKVGGVECFVESQHISNCDFVEDELIAWWQKTSENKRIPVVKDLKSKLAVRRTLGV
ncbi:hypothetical protein M8C21_029168 [Ambrosia artemisiifolia]|uniref:Plus3 domain-containing protein n=1 Tax=Ambrosia artemisiifolia TaxID=4212 RepID=A0AAD5DE86_AMBAR|nr:hypothetical protein M8C21_029168 [Ambrosia artemisiifolia]